MKVKTLEELVNEGALEGKRVFIRADMNVPRDAEGNVTDDHRLKESMPAVKMALKGGAGVMVCSHLGRPKEGELTEQDSLAKLPKLSARCSACRSVLKKNGSTAWTLSPVKS